MFAIPAQISNASKASLEANLALLSSLSSKTFEGVEKLVELNLNTAKASLEESTAVLKQLLSVKEPQEFFSVAAAQAQPSAEKALSYSRHLASITSDVHAEFTKVTEEQIAAASKKVLELVDEVTKNAPAGTENVVAIVKSAIGNANAGYEQFSKVAKQAAETLETNLNNAVSQFSQTSAKASRKK